MRNPGGEYNQLATTLLQIENEFYGTIRPKRVIRSGERPLHALRERGVEYVEVRCMDLDPFVPVGIEAPTMRFIDVFLLHCLLSDSPPDTPRRDRRAGAQPARSGGARPRAGPAARARSRQRHARRVGRRADRRVRADRRPARRRVRRQRLPRCARRGADSRGARPSTCRRRACCSRSGRPTVAPTPRSCTNGRCRRSNNCWPCRGAVTSRRASSARRNSRWPSRPRSKQADTMPFEAFRQDYVSADRLMPALATAA